MKCFVKLLILISLTVGVSTRSNAQSSIDGQNQSEKFFSLLDLEHFTKNLRLITDKFENTDYVTVLFSDSIIKLNVHKRAPQCIPATLPNGASEKQCPQVVAESELIRLQVQRVVKGTCSDLYYARTVSDQKSEVFEQVVLENIEVGRCPTTASLVATHGRLFYRISGLSKATDKQGTAQIQFSLRSVEPVDPTEPPSTGTLD